MENSARILAGITAAFLLPGLPAVAQEVCGDFTAYYRINDVYTDDRGEPGPGPADVRHGAAELFDETDATNGEFYWTSTLMPRHAEGLEDTPYPFIVAGRVSMPTGTLSFSGVADRADSRSKALPSKTFVYAVDGGTGVFAGARGEMEASTVDGEDRRTLRFTLTCDG